MCAGDLYLTVCKVSPAIRRLLMQFSVKRKFVFAYGEGV